MNYDKTVPVFLESRRKEGKSKKVLVKFISCMNLRMIAYIFQAQKCDVHMKGALILLTPEQIDILFQRTTMLL